MYRASATLRVRPAKVDETAVMLLLAVGNVEPVAQSDCLQLRRAYHDINEWFANISCLLS